MSEPDDDGGLGGIHRTRMEARAIMERWPMPEAVRVKVLQRLCKIIDEDADHAPLEAPGHREVIAASRALLAADALNLEQQRIDLAKEQGGDVEVIVTYAEQDIHGQAAHAPPEPGAGQG